MKTHAEQELLSAFVDGELTEREQVTVEAHLASCADCRSVLSALRATLADLASIPDAVPGPQDSWALRSAIAKERRVDRRARRWYLISGGAAAAVVAVLAFAMSTGGGGMNASGGGARLAKGPAITFSSVNYTEASAQEVLLRFSSEAPQAATLSAEAGRTTTGGPGAGSVGGVSGAHTNEFATDTYSRQADASDTTLQACVDAIPRSAGQTLRPRYYEAAAFDGVPVFLLVFESPSAKRLELWIVRRDNCETKFWAQTRA